MNQFVVSFLMIVFVFGHAMAVNQELQDELRAMRTLDQEAREKFINTGDYEEMHIIDFQNLPRVKMIITQFGWPGFQLVGEEGADNFWLLVQHCDYDVGFQKLCLAFLVEAVAKNDAKKWHVAYLRDRVLVNQGKEQIYGTQLITIDGKVHVQPMVEPHEVDKRRAEMGLCILEEYLFSFREDYEK